MARLFCVGVLIALNGFSASICFAQPQDAPNKLTAEEKRAGCELLFDGQTRKGWRSPSSDQFPDGFWVIEDGFLRGAEVGNRSTDLITAGAYRDFDLRFEWKIEPGGNSGVKYLVGSFQRLVFEGNKPPNIEGTVTPGPDAVFKITSGMEYQLVDEERHPDGKKSTTRSGSLYEFVGFDQSLVRPAGQLNHSRVVVNGNHIEHWLNGVRVVSTDVTSVEFQKAAAKAPARTRRALEYLNNKEYPNRAPESHRDALVPQHQTSQTSCPERPKEVLTGLSLCGSYNACKSTPAPSTSGGRVEDGAIQGRPGDSKAGGYGVVSTSNRKPPLRNLISWLFSIPLH